MAQYLQYQDIRTQYTVYCVVTHVLHETITVFYSPVSRGIAQSYGFMIHTFRLNKHATSNIHSFIAHFKCGTPGTTHRHSTYPYLQFYSFVVVINGFHFKVDADSTDKCRCESVVGVSKQKTSFADTRISDYQKFKHKIKTLIRGIFLFPSSVRYSVSRSISCLKDVDKQ